MDLEAIAYHGVRSYWLVRYLEEVHPGFIRLVFSRRLDSGQIEQELAEVFDMDSRGFWSKIDWMIADYFERRLD